MGRKPINETAKNSGVLVRLTDSERAELDFAAVAAGKPTATWVRDLALSAARSNSTPPATAVKKPKRKPVK